MQEGEGADISLSLFPFGLQRSWQEGIPAQPMLRSSLCLELAPRTRGGVDEST